MKQLYIEVNHVPALFVMYGNSVITIAFLDLLVHLIEFEITSRWHLARMVIRPCPVQYKKKEKHDNFWTFIF